MKDDMAAPRSPRPWAIAQLGVKRRVIAVIPT